MTHTLKIALLSASMLLWGIQASTLAAADERDRGRAEPRPEARVPGGRPGARPEGRLSPLLSRREPLLFQRRHLVCAARTRIHRSEPAAGPGDLDITPLLRHGMDRRCSLLLCRRRVLLVAAGSK